MRARIPPFNPSLMKLEQESKLCCVFWTFVRLIIKNLWTKHRATFCACFLCDWWARQESEKGGWLMFDACIRLLTMCLCTRVFQRKQDVLLVHSLLFIRLFPLIGKDNKQVTCKNIAMLQQQAIGWANVDMSARPAASSVMFTFGANVLAAGRERKREEASGIARRLAVKRPGFRGSTASKREKGRRRSTTNLQWDAEVRVCIQTCKPVRRRRFGETRVRERAVR